MHPVRGRPETNTYPHSLPIEKCTERETPQTLFIKKWGTIKQGLERLMPELRGGGLQAADVADYQQE